MTRWYYTLIDGQLDRISIQYYALLNTVGEDTPIYVLDAKIFSLPTEHILVSD